MAFAFGMHPLFQSVYRRDDNVLRMGLLETTTRSPSTAVQDAQDIKAIRQRPNVVVAIGNRITTNSFDRWLKELAQVHDEQVHVHWIHTKYMLIDPLGKNPVLVTGSANFSKASTDTNDENMLVIQGNKRIADIYFGEYMRLYNHYAFREAVNRALDQKKVDQASDWKPQYLEIKDD
ncbi:MAG: phospholipase D-like domain-containing protein [Pseudomonadota bacterium]